MKLNTAPVQRRAGGAWRSAARLLVLLWACMCLVLVALSLPGAPWLDFLADFPRHLLAWTLLFWLPWLLLLPLARHLAGRFSYGKEGSRGFWFEHAGCLLALALGHLAALQAVRLSGLAPALDAVVFPALVFPLLDALAYGHIVADRNLRRLSRELRERRVDAARLNRNLSESRLQTLKMQLNPHFLFNTLNGISVLVEKRDNEQAQEMIGELSKFLRQTLSNSREKWISLERELSLVREYLSIEKIRFGARLSYFEECEPIALAAKVPPMLLQPLFENTIVHGLAEKQGPCRLNFECRVHARRLFILISDNGEGFDAARDPAHRAGIGLANIHARLKEVYGDDYSLALEQLPGGGTQVDLRIPAYKDSSVHNNV